MKWIALSFYIALQFIPMFGHAQMINDCATAQVVCDDSDLAFNPDGPGLNDFADPDNDEGCITALEQNSAWYYFQIDPNAPPGLILGFIIHPKGGLGEDYDWALYGPDVDCGDLGSPIRCSSSSAACGFCPDTGMGMGTTDVTEGPGTGDGFVSTLPVQPGQGFYLLIDNWAGTTNGFILTWTETAADYLNCDAQPPCSLDAVAGPDIDACEGETDIELEGGSNGNHGSETYSWSGTNGGTDFLSNPDIENPTVTLPSGFTGTIIYTLTVAEDTCVSEDEFELTVNPLPFVNINQIGPFCENDLPQALSGTPGGGIWGGAATGNTFNPMTNGPGIHTVTYTYTDGNGCMNTDEMDIEVHEKPEVTIDPDPAEFCDSENAILLTATGSAGAGGYMYTWNTPTGTGDGVTYSASLSGAHNVTVTDANGCTNTSVTSVLSHPNPTVEIMDPGPVCENLTSIFIAADPPGGSFYGSNIDPTGELYPDVLGPGTYSVSYTYTDNNNCEGTTTENITIIPIPEATAENNGPLCEGETIALIGSTNGTGSTITYQWSGPNGYMSNVQNPANATQGGTYVLEVTVDGCPSVPTATFVSVVTAPEAFAQNNGPYCTGQTIQLLGSTNGSGSNITYQWTGPNGYTSDVQSPTDATLAGTYSLVVNIDGCPSAVTTTEVVFNTPPNATAINSGPYCQGEVIALSGNTTTTGTTINYAWTGPNGYQSAVQNPNDAPAPGIYSLVVTVDGCQSAVANTTVTVNSLPTPVISGQNAFCTGFSSTMDAGAGYSSYLWDNASVNQTLEVFAPGTYHVTVTDVNGCSANTSFAVAEIPSLTPVISGVLAFCEGSGTTIDAGPGYVNYMWSTGETSQSIDVTTNGNFGVLVTDADGCTGSTNVTITENPTPNVTIGGSTTYCIGGFTVLDAGTGYTSYTWSNATTTQSITVSSPGVFSVDVIDNNGCAGSASATITESTSLSPVITGNPAFCENGTTTLNAGSGFSNYLWSDGSSAQLLLVNAAGIYAVTVSDGQGCSGETSVSISEVLPPSAQLQATTSLCNTIAGGSVLNLYDLILSGDNTGTWDDTDNSGAVGLFTNLNFNNVAAGDYRFTYTTNSAIDPCPETQYQVIVTIIDCTCPDVFFFATNPLCNASDVLDVTTIENTAEAGTWTLIQQPPGTNPATLTGTLFDATGGDPGDYQLQFTLQNQPPPGCPLDYTVTVQVDPGVEAGIAAAPVSYCFDDGQLVTLPGLLTGEDSGGTWTETSNVSSLGAAFNPTNGTFQTDNQTPAIYTFNYALASGGACPDDAAEVTVEITPLPTVVVVDNATLDCNNPVQSLNAEGSSYGSGYSIVWTGPGIIADGNEGTLNPTIDEQGSYLLTITNTLTGCINTGTVNVIANTDAPTGAQIDSDDPDCFGDENGYIAISQVVGGTAPFLYSFNGSPFSNNLTYNNLTPGDYTLELEDANGCKWDTLITLNSSPQITLDLGVDLELGLGESGIVQAIINLPDNEIDTLIWAPDQFITCIDVACMEANVFPPSTVTLSATVYDLNGCNTTDEVQIVVNKDRRFYIPTVFSPNGDGINDVFFIMGDPDQIVKVQRFAIFNRWGETIYEGADFQPNDSNEGWNGYFKSEVMNPGVFVYVAAIEFIDGVVLQLTGDVTLMR